MAKDINLLSYWMPELKQFKEFKEVAKAEEPELRYLLEAVDRTLNNMFIETADEYGIKRFENMMGIYPEEGESLDTRRFNVLVKWNDKVPYTDKELYNRLLSICGSADRFSIAEHYTDYWIEVITHLGIAGAFDAVTSLLQDMLPCNLELDLKNTLEAKKTTPLYVGGVICTAMAYQITNDINCEYVGGGHLYYGNSVSHAGTHIITHDISSKVAEGMELNTVVVGSVGSAGVITHDIELGDVLTGELNGAIGTGVAHTHIITHDLQSRANIASNSTIASPISNATVITIN